MVKLTENDKTLVVPAGLGNFGQSSGSGGSGMTPQEVQDMIDTSIEEYDTEIQVDIEDLSDRISGNTDNIAELSGATVALKEQVDGISLSGITADIEALSGQTSANTQNIGVLSGVTTALTSSVDNLAGAVTALTEGVESLSGQTTANTQNIEAVSGAVETLSESLTGYTTTDTFNSGISGVQGQISGLSEGVAELSAFTSGLSFTVSEQAQNLEQLSGATEAVEQAVSGKQDTLSAGNGIEISGATISVKAGEGLGFSGDTLVVSGGTGGGQVFYIDNIYGNHQDLATLLFGYWDWNNGMISSAYPADDLHVYMWLGQDFQGAFDMPTKGYIELFPDSVYEEDGMYFMNLTGVYVHENTAYTFKYGLASNGDSRGNWTQPVFNFSFGNYISYCRFGNDGRGYLTYDADNDRFEYDSAYVSTGDTSNACPDLVDWLLTKQGLIDGGLIFDYICVQNLNKFFVVENGETKTYTHPSLGWKELSSPYTIGDYTFGYEITYKYTDWELKIDVSEGNNVGANVRISAV